MRAVKGGVGAEVRSLFLPRLGEKVLEVTANLTETPTGFVVEV